MEAGLGKERVKKKRRKKERTTRDGEEKTSVSGSSHRFRKNRTSKNQRIKRNIDERTVFFFFLFFATPVSLTGSLAGELQTVVKRYRLFAFPLLVFAYMFVTQYATLEKRSLSITGTPREESAL